LAPPLPAAFLAPALRDSALLLLPHQVVVKDELVAIRDQQVRGRILDADADHHLVVLAQLGHQRREIGVAADDHESLDMRFGIAKVECIDHHADVGEFLPDWRTCGISISSNDASCIGALNAL
jgi:hypothetical protein